MFKDFCKGIHRVAFGNGRQIDLQFWDLLSDHRGPSAQLNILVADPGKVFFNLDFRGNFLPPLCGTKAPEFNQGPDADVESSAAEDADLLRNLYDTSSVLRDRIPIGTGQGVEP